MTGRRWAMQPRGDGRYLLHGNDVDPDRRAGTVFLISRWEDGPELGVERRATRWSLREAPFRALVDAVLDGDWPDPVDDVAWQDVADYPRRADAIDAAVLRSERYLTEGINR